MKSRSKCLTGIVLLVFCLVGVPIHAAGDKSVVNINTAAAEQLMFLPRVGPSVAQRIIEFREQNGKFKSVEELMLVRGVGEKTFALIKPHVTVTGDTTLTEKVKVAKQDSSDT